MVGRFAVARQPAHAPPRGSRDFPTMATLANGRARKMAYDFELLKVRVDAGVAFATIANPPINLITLPLMGELARFAREVAADDAVRAVVLRSDDPEFWLAHFDVAAILAFPTAGEPARASRADENPYHAMCELYRTMAKATIAEIGGRAGKRSEERRVG